MPDPVPGRKVIGDRFATKSAQPPAVRTWLEESSTGKFSRWHLYWQDSTGGVWTWSPHWMGDGFRPFMSRMAALDIADRLERGHEAIFPPEPSTSPPPADRCPVCGAGPFKDLGKHRRYSGHPEEST